MVGASRLLKWCHLGWPLCFALCSCSVYDVGLLDPPSVVQPPMTGGTGGGGGGSGGRGSGGAGGSGGADAGKPMSLCGDGMLTGDERCDIAIANGQPGACPTECTRAAECAPRVVSGSACNAECIVVQLTCKKGDGCCPGNCTTDNDADCSSRCGDGMVQTADGETCDPGSDDDAGVAGQPCLTLADCDDKNPCTSDLLLGSALNCNATCSHVEITEPKSGDGCCPSGSNMQVDSDCKPVCGNGVKEDGEQCEGGEDCNPTTCKSTLTADQQKCMDLVGAAGNACDRCSCKQCTTQQLACRASDNATRNAHCATILKCSNEKDCTRTACYCADPNDLIGCGLGAAGPCRAEIDEAATENPRATVTDQQDDPNTSINRAIAVTDCNNDMKCRDCP